MELIVSYEDSNTEYDDEEYDDLDEMVATHYTSLPQYKQSYPQNKSNRRHKMPSDLAFIASQIEVPDIIPTIKIPTSIPEKTISINHDSDSDDGSDDNDDDDVSLKANQVVEHESSEESDMSGKEDNTKKDILKIEHNTIKKKLVHWLTEEEDQIDGNDGPLKTKNEIIDEPILIVEDEIIVNPQNDIEPIGEVLYRIDTECSVVVQSRFTTNPLNEGSLLCNKDGIILGKINEIFGPITTPFYIVKWKEIKFDNDESKIENANKKKNKKNNSNNNNNKPIIQESVGMEMDTGVDHTANNEETVTNPITDDVSIPMENELIEIITPQHQHNHPPSDESQQSLPSLSHKIKSFIIGCPVYSVITHRQLITAGAMNQLRNKGSDASNEFDEEPGEGEIEYSDDEQEALAKQKKKSKNLKNFSNNNTNQTDDVMDFIPPAATGTSIRGKQNNSFHKTNLPHAANNNIFQNQYNSNNNNNYNNYNNNVNNSYNNNGFPNHHLPPPPPLTAYNSNNNFYDSNNSYPSFPMMLPHNNSNYNYNMTGYVNHMPMIPTNQPPYAQAPFNNHHNGLYNNSLSSSSNINQNNMNSIPYNNNNNFQNYGVHPSVGPSSSSLPLPQYQYQPIKFDYNNYKKQIQQSNTTPSSQSFNNNNSKQ
eukprot:gene8078-10941_t